MSKEMKGMKIAVAGTGYVGLSNAVLLAQHNEIVVVGIVQDEPDLINQKKITNRRQGNPRVSGKTRAKFDRNDLQGPSL